MAESITDGAAIDFDALADRRMLQLDDAQWEALMIALDAPAADNPALRALPARKPAWEG